MNNLFAVPILDKFLVVSPLRDTYALINKSALEVVAEQTKQPLKKVDSRLEDFIAFLKEPVTPLAFDVHKRKLNPLFLGLIPSRRCNLSCVYCGFGATLSSDNKLSPEQCIGAIDYYAQSSLKNGKQECQIQFFGGEPFVEGDIIDIAVHRARMIAAKTGLCFTFETSTNGYCSESRARFIGEYIDITVLSLDGFKKFHDRNRPVINPGEGSFNRVTRTARILSNSSTDLCIRCCITQESVNSMSDMVRWFCKEFKPGTISFETLQENELSAKAALFAPDPLEFAYNYIQAAQVARSLGVSPVYAAIESRTPRHTFCPLGRDSLICGPDGFIYGCYLQPNEWESRGMDLTLGKISQTGKVHINMDDVVRVRQYTVEKPRCNNCFCRYSCAGGCHVNNTWPGAPITMTDFCKQTRVITACSMLSSLGLDGFVHKVINSRAAMEAIADYPCDTIGEMGI